MDAILAAGIARVVVGVEDPDPNVSGTGIARLRDAGLQVDVGCREHEVRAQLAPYLKHRATGRPWVVLKLAATLDGRTAAADGSQPVDHRRGGTGRRPPPAGRERRRHRRGGHGAHRRPGAHRPRHAEGRDPLRVVLGHAPLDAKVHPAIELQGDLGDVLDELGRRGVLQALVEGGATVAGAFHRAGLVDRYVLYLAPALAGGDDGRPLLAGPGAPTIDDLWRGRIVSVDRLGDDLRLEVECSPA